MPLAPRAHSKTYKVPRRPYESARLDAELKVGQHCAMEGLMVQEAGYSGMKV